MSRKHHLVPVFYLARFTDGGTSESPIYVLDKATGKGRWATPKSTAYEKGFYEVDTADGQNTDEELIENFYAQRVEPFAASVLRDVDTRLAVPKRNTVEYAQLMCFLASTFVRGRSGWDMATQAADHFGRMTAREMLTTPGAWGTTLAELGLQSDSETDLSVSAMLDFVRDATFDLDRNTKLDLLVGMIAPLARLLASCQWHVVGRQAGTPSFLLSDQPLSIQWSPGHERRSAPTVGDPDNAFLIPIGRELVLRGIRHGSVHVRQLSTRAIEHVNALTAFHGHRFVYSHTDNIRARAVGDSGTGEAGILNAHKHRVVFHDMSGGPDFDTHGLPYLTNP